MRKHIALAQLAIPFLAASLSAQNLTGPAFQDLLKFDAGQGTVAPVPAAHAAPVQTKQKPAGPSLTIFVGLGATDASKGPVEADNLLKPLGITVSKATKGSHLYIVDARTEYDGKAVAPPSATDPNMLEQRGAYGKIEFTLKFDRPVCSFSFTRPALLAGQNGISHPAWTATAFTGKTPVDSASERMIRYFDSTKPDPRGPSLCRPNPNPSP